jgi:hypothetical protein
MDADDKFQELKSALKEWNPVKEPDPVKINEIDLSDLKFDTMAFNGLTSYQIPTLTTAQISAIPSITVSVGGAGGGGGGGGYAYTQAIPAPNTHSTINNAGLNTSIGTYSWTQSSGVVKIDAQDIEVNGRSVLATLTRIEQQLGILDPDLNLEDEWQELKKIGEEYRKKHEHIQSKLATFNRLKSNPPEVKK